MSYSSKEIPLKVSNESKNVEKSEILNMLEVYENKSETNIEENIICKSEMLKKLADYKNTLTINDLMVIMNIRTDDEKLAHLKLMKTEDEKVLKDIIELEYLEFTNHPSYIKNWSQLIGKQMVGIQFATRIIEKKWLKIYDIFSRDKKNYLHQQKQFGCIKSAFLKFEMNIIITNYNLFFDIESEKDNTKAVYTTLENRLYDLWEIENVILKQMKMIMSPEASYMILTWMSPSVWKKRYNIGRLKYEFAVSDIEVNKTDNKQRYLLYAWDKTLERFLVEIQENPVLEMYWTSAEQFNKALNYLEKKTVQKMKILDMICSLRSKNNEMSIQKKPYNYIKRKARRALKHKLISMRHKIAEMIRKKNEKDFECLKNITHSETFFKIKSMLQNICMEQEYTLSGFFSKPYQMFEYLTSHLAHVVKQRSKISTTHWNATEQILQLIEHRQEKKNRFRKTMFNTITATIHSANKTYDDLSNIRKEKMLPFRSQVPEQHPSTKPKGPTLNEEQMMYLKCLTYLSPKNVSNYIPYVPEMKMD